MWNLHKQFSFCFQRNQASSLEMLGIENVLICRSALITWVIRVPLTILQIGSSQFLSFFPASSIAFVKTNDWIEYQKTDILPVLGQLHFWEYTTAELSISKPGSSSIPITASYLGLTPFSLSLLQWGSNDLFWQNRGGEFPDPKCWWVNEAKSCFASFLSCGKKKCAQAIGAGVSTLLGRESHPCWYFSTHYECHSFAGPLVSMLEHTERWHHLNLAVFSHWINRSL